MRTPMERERRRHRRVRTKVPVHFDLDPDYHYVPSIKKFGIVGTVQNVSAEGLGIDARMDLLDVCQIFPEELVEGAAFVLDVFFVDSRGRRVIIKAEVRWYKVGHPGNGIRAFEAGLYLRDGESKVALKAMRLG
jgi:hypothetical protein